MDAGRSNLHPFGAKHVSTYVRNDTAHRSIHQGVHTMPTSRVQLALNVDNLEDAIGFYAKLFGTEPAKRRPATRTSPW